MGESFRVLGSIPDHDLLGLMRNSVAILNPSLFEGWSTSVEEAKSLGKTVLLSDIAVHREQAPDLGVYFHPQDAEDLACKLWSTLADYDPNIDARNQEKCCEQTSLQASRVCRELSADCSQNCRFVLKQDEGGNRDGSGQTAFC